MERPPGCGVDGGDCNRFMPPPPSARNMVNSKVMVVAVVVLFAVVVFILCLHIYAKWFWRHHGVAVVAGDGTIRTLSWRRRRYRGDPNVQNGTTVTQSVGLELAVVEALPSFVYSGEKDEGMKECVVCLEEFEDGERGRTLPKCGHGFHLECIDMWLHSHSTCPLCRTNVGADEEEDTKGSSEAVTVVEIGQTDGPVVGDVGAPFMATMRQHRRSRSRPQVPSVNSLPRTEEGNPRPEEESGPVPVAERELALQQSLKDYETPGAAATSGSSIRAPFQVTIDIPRAGGGGTNNPVVSNSLSPMARASASFRRLLSRGKSVVTPQSPPEEADEGGPSSSPRPPPPSPPSV